MDEETFKNLVPLSICRREDRLKEIYILILENFTIDVREGFWTCGPEFGVLKGLWTKYNLELMSTPQN